MRCPCLPLFLALAAAAQGGFRLEQVRGYAFPNELTAATKGSRVAWAFNEAGRRNLWVAEGPEFRARRLTNYQNDDGQELSSVSISSDGKYVVYVRGGDHGANWDRGVAVNAVSSPVPFRVQVWSVPFAGGEPKLLGDGDRPVISPAGDRVAIDHGREISVAPIDGSARAKRMFTARGDLGSPQWSPDGKRLAFVATRTDHAFIGVYTDDNSPILWLAPSASRDSSPRWSPDGKRIAFVRRPGAGGPPEPMLTPRPAPWSIWSADATTGEGRQLWKSGGKLRDSLPTTHGATNLHWAPGRIVFLSYADGWPHLYSMPEDGGPALLLTPGKFMAEHISLSPDGRYLLAAANTGPLAEDIDRRHVLKIPIDRAEAKVLTPGAGLEWSPVATGDGASIVFLGATAQRPPLPMVMPAGGGTPRVLAEDAVPQDFPTAQLVTPKQVVFKAPDGLTIHAQLFEAAGGAAKKPAIIYVHGGPPRQMLLGWNYSDYYANAYALNQYLASRGYIVLAVNYRLGIGYGYEFHHPANGGARGAAEYQDIKGAALYLRGLARVDAKRIGIYGGSYGGYLTALALGRNSDLFAAGVDIHGVHSYGNERARTVSGFGYEKPVDAQKAVEVAWQSSPISSVATWRSPVLLIHGDDDRNVNFAHTVDLVQRLARTQVNFEVMIVPDDTHHFMRHANWVKVSQATADFFDRQFHMKE